MNNKSIIIIGNGQSILNNELQDEIDAFDIVVRINNYKINGYEHYLGTKTDIWFNGANSNGVRTAWHIHTDGKLKLYEQENSNTSAAGSSISIRLNEWNHVVSIRQSDNNLRSYINGKESTTSFTARNLDQNDMAVMVGGDRWNNGSSPITGADTTKMALFRIGKGSPTADVVRKIYDDEKKLFVPNAKCTLYGSSDVVTAIAYDDSNDTVHAGTSSGRSEFVGLNRINNTTTAITTSISTSDGLVAEQ